MISHLPKGRDMELSAEQQSILTPAAIQFLNLLAKEFEPQRQQLLQNRQKRLNQSPQFLTETATIREGNWRVAPIPTQLENRKVEITGPVDRKMIINGLNSGAMVYMADFEDSNSPTWTNNLDGQVNLRDAVRKTITYQTPQKTYQLNNTIATLFVRPRGWHLVEKHFLVENQPISASIFDFGLFFFHNAQQQLKNNEIPCFYLPKIESHLEARLWNDIFKRAQDFLGIPQGTIRATVLIETIWAAFEMDEILYELKDHSAGLNCGRWDYIFSFIKTFKNDSYFILPNRSQVTMTQHFLASYVKLLIATCHKRGIHAMGGMAAQIPIKNDPAANQKALDKVREDKLREVKAGHDGTWVAHPDLVPLAKEIFEANLKTNHQIAYIPEATITQDDLLRIPEGTITEEGVRNNINVSILYLSSWLKGKGCVPLYNLMEDAATAEIARTQVWQWLHHSAKLNDGRVIDSSFVKSIVSEEVSKITASGVDCELATQIFSKLILSEDYSEFLTISAYNNL